MELYTCEKFGVDVYFEVGRQELGIDRDWFLKIDRQCSQSQKGNKVSEMVL